MVAKGPTVVTVVTGVTRAAAMRLAPTPNAEPTPDPDRRHTALTPN